MADLPPRRSTGIAGVPTPVPVRQRLVAAVSEHLPFKATALLLALILWLVVNAKEPQVELLPVQFLPLFDSSLVLREPAPPLQALVAGSPRELIKLGSGGAVVRRQITSRTPDPVVIDLLPGDVTLPGGVDAVVRDIQPRSVTLRFEPIAVRRVSVTSLVDVSAAATGPMHVVFEPATVEITGPAHLIERIRSVPTVRATLPFPDSLPHLVDLDTTGLGAVRVRPAQVKAEVRPRVPAINIP
jgi:hypothetical protein